MKHNMMRLFIATIFGLFLTTSISAGLVNRVGVIFVDADASDGGDGTSWGSAFNDLQDALQVSVLGDEIWVAEGVYKPDRETTDRDMTFQLLNGVGIFGGFAGNETERLQRDWVVNITLLSGDLLEDDDKVGVTDNSKRIVTGSGTDETAVISGFVISGAYATGGYPVGAGAGIYNVSGSPTILDNIITDNFSRFGSGIENHGNSQPNIINCIISGNTADELVGGGIISFDQSHPVLINCILSGNYATDRGGAVFVEGSTASITLINCSLSQNSAGIFGGGIAVYSNGSVQVVNCILWGNIDPTGTTEGAQITLSNSSADVDYSCIQGLTGGLGGIGNIAGNPRFLDPDGADNIIGTPDDDLRLGNLSPVVDAADNTAVPPDTFDLDGDLDTTESIPYDVFYSARFYDDLGMSNTGNGVPPNVDMGAHERDFDSVNPGLYIGPKGGSWFDPDNWAGGQVPDEQTDVVIPTSVFIDQPDADAATVLIVAGGRLTITTGVLITTSINVLSGGALLIDHNTAWVTVDMITVQDGAEFALNSGGLLLNSGTSFIPGNVLIGATGPGTLELNSNATLNSNKITVGSSSLLRGSGILSSSVVNKGTIKPGFPLGTLTITGLYDQRFSGRLLVEISGYKSGVEFGSLSVGGDIYLDGTLEVSVWEEFVPVLFGTQIFMENSSEYPIAGRFSSIILPNLSGDFAFIVRENLHTNSLFTIQESIGSVAYVNIDAADGGDGLSWSTAFNKLQDAWDLADSGQYPIVEIWVAMGTYHPTLRRDINDPRSVRFYFRSDLHILGGFVGNETNSYQRDWIANETILSGDLGVKGDYSDNTYHVLYDNGAATETAVYDGFTISDGWCGPIEDRGAGIRSSGDGTLRNCTVRDNIADFQGGGVYVTGRMTFIDCAFINNTATQREGGAVFASDRVRFIGCTFENNQSSWGGGAIFSGTHLTIKECTFRNNAEIAVYISTSSTRQIKITDSLFENNSSIGRAGALYIDDGRVLIDNCQFISNTANSNDGGAIWLRDSRAGSAISRTVFLGNQSAARGGGVYASTDSITVSDCLFSGNSANNGGGGMYISSGTPLVIEGCIFSRNSSNSTVGGLYISTNGGALSNTILWGNDVSGNTDEASQIAWVGSTPDINYSCIQNLTGGFGGSGNIGSDPNFVDDIGVDFIPGTIDDNLRLMAGSPCIDSGDNLSVVPDVFDLDSDSDYDEPVPLDMDGEEHFFDDPDTVDTGNGTAPIVDMGSYEGPDTEAGNQPGIYIGPHGGSWFNANHWVGLAVPDASTNVFIQTEVIIDQMGAVAANVHIEQGGNLIVTTGSLTTQLVAVFDGSFLTLDDDSAVVTTHSLYVMDSGQVNWRAGSIVIDGGIWSNSGDIRFGHIGNAILLVLNDGSLLADNVFIDLLGIAFVDGTITGDVNNAGTLEPGISQDRLTINGNYVQTIDGTLTIEIDGYVPEIDYDALKVNGTATFGGTLAIEITKEFIPEIGLINHIIETDSIISAFDSLDFQDLPGLLTFLQQVDGDVIRLQTVLQSTGSRIYVNAAAVPAGDGQTWQTALRNLQGALLIAELNAETVTEVWVAEGTYLPDLNTGDRNLSFELLEGLAVYGSFAGDENDVSERNISQHPSVLSGDLLDNDESGVRYRHASLLDNSLHVVTANGLTSLTSLDGFVIQAGHAGDNDGNTYDGAGLHNISGNPVVRNCTFQLNKAGSRGGGIYNELGDMLLEDCTFIDNWAEDGGGMYNLTCNPTLRRCTFTRHLDTDCLHNEESSAHIEECSFILNGPEDESSGWSRGILNQNASDSVITGCTFEDNIGNSAGAAILNRSSDPIMLNCLFRNNRSPWVDEHGGAVINSLSNSVFVTCEFDGNQAKRNGGAVRSAAGTVSFTDCIFTNNSSYVNGGAVSQASNDATFTNCTFIGNNSDQRGGAIFNKSSSNTEVTDCIFTDNSAGEAGGAIYNWHDSLMNLVNNNFAGNAAPEGSAIYNNRATLSGVIDAGISQSATNAGYILVGDIDESSVIGTMKLPGGYQHRILNNGGAVSPKLTFDIAGTVPGVEHDLLDVSGGVVELDGGGLQANFINGYDPAIGQQFNIINADSVSGMFDVIGINGLFDGKYLNVENDSEGVKLTVEEIEGTIGFADPNLLELSTDANDAVIGDFDQDGDEDIAMVFPQKSEMIVMLNAGNDDNGNWLGFTEGFTVIGVGNVPVALEIAYFNDDEYPDLAVVNVTSNDVSILLNNATDDATFTLSQTIEVSEAPIGLAAARLDANSSTDIAIVSRTDSAITLLMNDGSGVFTIGPIIQSGTDARSIVLADVSNDGFVDVLTLTQTLIEEQIESVLGVHIASDGNGAFELPAFYIVGSDPINLIADDFNGDTFEDIAVVDNSNASVFILVNEGDSTGTFLSPVDLQTGVQPTSITTLDIENDGDRDIAIVADNLNEQRVVQLIRNDFNGNQLIFAVTTELDTGGEVSLVTTGDINNDDLEDIVAINVISEGAGPGTASIAGLLNISGPAIATLNDLTIINGVLLDGDVGMLDSADDAYVHTRSGFGATFIDLHNMEMLITASTEVVNPITLGLSIESRINQPSGFVQLRMRNWNTDLFEPVGQYSIGLNEEEVRINQLDGTKFVSKAGSIELSVKHIVFVPFIAFTFESFIDQVRIRVE